MDLIWDGIREALRLIFTGNGEVYEIALLSLTVSGAATGIALVIGLSVASFLAFRAPPGRTVVLSVLNSGMAPLPERRPRPHPRRNGWIRSRHLGGRRHHHGGRQHQGVDPYSPLRHR